MKKITRLTFLAFLALTVLLNGCAIASTPASTSSPVPPTFTPKPTVTPIIYNVEISVTDENGNMIPEAKIILGDTVEFTDSQGVWRKSLQTSEITYSIWAQGYLLQETSSTLVPGENKINTQLSADPFGLSVADLVWDGYKLVFVEDFQDNISDCEINGNAAVIPAAIEPENFLMLVDLRGIEDGFNCSFGPTNVENAIIEASFRYPEIRYSDFKENDYYNWQGYAVEFRDGYSVNGYPLQVPWGATLQITDFTESEWKFPVTTKQSIQENRWYTLNTLYDGVRLEVRMNGSLKFSYLKFPITSNKEPSSIGAYSQSYIQFDNIKMWIPDN